MMKLETVELVQSQVELNMAQALAQKAQAAKLLVDAGYNHPEVLRAVGLPAIKIK